MKTKTQLTRHFAPLRPPLRFPPRLTNERDELRNLNVRLSGRDEQYKAGGRKRENDYAKLQKQLQTLSNQRTKDSKYKAFVSTGNSIKKKVSL